LAALATRSCARSRGAARATDNCRLRAVATEEKQASEVAEAAGTEDLAGDVAASAGGGGAAVVTPASGGTIHTVIGLVYIIDVLQADTSRFFTGAGTEHLPFPIVLWSMLFGAINALSGLQPALLPRPFKDVLQLLGIGENGNLKAAGFVNTAAFYFFLTYQSLRVLPEYPVWLQPFDPLFAGATLVALVHAIFIINSWVSRGLSQGFALGMSLPLLLNVPPSYHLLLEGQAWVDKLTAIYPGWPLLFFSANYALAWAGSFVTLVLSLYERKVCSITDRLLLTLLAGAITFVLIPLRGYLLVPEWFQGQWMVMLTLTPPS